MRRYRRVIIVALPVATLLTIELLLHRRTVPPPNVTTLDTFLQWRQPDRDFEVVAGPGGEHVMAVGARSGLLPSSPSAYVFDWRGLLVDWSDDIGDDFAFEQKWEPYHPTRQLKATALPMWLDAPPSHTAAD